MGCKFIDMPYKNKISTNEIGKGNWNYQVFTISIKI